MLVDFEANGLTVGVDFISLEIEFFLHAVQMFLFHKNLLGRLKVSKATKTIPIDDLS